MIVSGGSGSGKSLVALSLLGELGRRGRTVVHATGSRSFTQTLRKVTSRNAPRVRSLFMYSNSFTDAERNGLDVLIADEAHRIRETSANRWPKASLRSGKAQLDELIDAARVPVFLLDEHQVVRPDESGTAADIEKAARARGLDVYTVNLNAQYRCGGSDAYLEWVEWLLGLRMGGPTEWVGDPPASLWASDPAGFGQLGCVYTAQGFEYEWNGVIIGPDLVWRGSGWTVVRSANTDPDWPLVALLQLPS